MELTRRVFVPLCIQPWLFAGCLVGGDVVSPNHSVDVRQIPHVVRVRLGECQVRDTCRATLLLNNHTQSRWTIRKIDTDCGCLSAEASDPRFEVDQTVRLEVKLKATSKIANVRRKVRVYFEETDAPLILHLDLSVLGPIRLKHSIFHLIPGRDSLEITGIKSVPGLSIDELFSGRGGFLVSGDIEQDHDSFHCVLMPLHRFGAFSDIVRVRYRDATSVSHVVEIPIEMRSVVKVRFLPSTVSLRRNGHHWVGETRMIVSPEAGPIDLTGLRFDFASRDSADDGTSADGRESGSETQLGKGTIRPLSQTLSIVQIAVIDDGKQTMPHFVEIEDRNGSLLGKLHLSLQGQEHDKN